jgi:hypothetical protein
MNVLKAQIRDGNPPTILEALANTSKCEATDYRDKIFSLRGLLSTTTNQFLQPNYNSTCEDVFGGVVMACIWESCSFVPLAILQEGLNRVHISQYEMATLDVPAWVINFCRNPPSRGNNDPTTRRALVWSEVLAQSVPNPVHIMGHLHARENDAIVSRALRRPNIEVHCADSHVVLTCSGLLCGTVKSYMGIDGANGANGAEEVVLPRGVVLKRDILTNEWLMHASELWKGNRTKKLSRSTCTHEGKCPEHDHRECEFYHLLYDLDEQLPVWWAKNTRRVLLCTDTGRLGLASHGITYGDSIAIIDETFLPAVLTPSGNHYKFRGYAYIPSLLDVPLSRFVEKDFEVRWG